MTSRPLTCEPPPGGAVAGELDDPRREHEPEHEPLDEPEVDAVVLVVPRPCQTTEVERC